MSGSCPVGAEVCREAHAEVERLRKEMHLRELHHFEVEFAFSRVRAASRDLAARVAELTAERDRLRRGISNLVTVWSATARMDSVRANEPLADAVEAVSGDLRDLLAAPAGQESPVAAPGRPVRAQTGTETCWPENGPENAGTPTGRGA